MRVNDFLIERIRKAAATVLGIVMFFVGSWTQAAGPIGDCGRLENPYGPYDYTNAIDRRDKLPRVERAHFDIGVRSLEGSRRKVFSWSGLVADIDYTLRAFPNHHAALYTMVTYHLRGYDDNALSQYTPECWFDRAKRFNSGDGNVWLIEGVYKARIGDNEDAEKSYLVAIEMVPDAPEPHYNLGLLYLSSKNYPLARVHAERAYALGYPMPGLRDKLAELGEWTE